MALKFFLILFIIILALISRTALIPRTAYSIPFVVFHDIASFLGKCLKKSPLSYHVLDFSTTGISERCGNGGVARFTTLLSNWSGSQGYCIEIGNGVWDSWTMPFLKQTAIACDKVKKMSELRDGYNIIGLSQGNMIGRGILEFCEGGPPVRNFISLAGPHAGIASVPFCGSVLVCILVDFLIQLAVYSSYVQEHLAPANYIKIPTDIDEYNKGCRFLPKLNNEIHRNSAYKDRFASLQGLVLIMFENDTVLVPKETSWFGYFPDGSWTPVLPAQETTLYTEDRIGLKSLVEAGKVKFIKVSGGHLKISYSDMKEYILPYLVENATTRLSITSESHIWPWSEHKGERLQLYTAN